MGKKFNFSVNIRCKRKTMTGRLRDLANNDLVHYHEDKGYQSKRWDNELY